MTQERLREIEGEARAERAFILSRYDSHLSPQIYGVIRKLELEIAWSAHRRIMRKQFWSGGSK